MVDVIHSLHRSILDLAALGPMDHKYHCANAEEGDVTLMTNYRGISLMSTAAKVYNKILLNRICDDIDPILWNIKSSRVLKWQKLRPTDPHSSEGHVGL